MTRRKLIIAAVLVPLVLFAVAVMSLEEPEYSVIERTDDLELRRYEPFIVAETRVEGHFSDAGARAFRILVGYIQGENRGGRNLPMTAPVNQQPAHAGERRDGQRIETPASMTQRADGDDRETAGVWLFQFVMPKEYGLAMLPEPLDERVTLRQVPERLVAARRYSGGWSEARYRDHERTLLEALRREDLTPVGEPIFARYNAPFVPWFLRRNEVLVEVEAPAGWQAPPVSTATDR